MQFAAGLGLKEAQILHVALELKTAGFWLESGSMCLCFYRPAAKVKNIRRGVKEVQKFINKGEKGWAAAAPSSASSGVSRCSWRSQVCLCVSDVSAASWWWRATRCPSTSTPTCPSCVRTEACRTPTSRLKWWVTVDRCAEGLSPDGGGLWTRRSVKVGWRRHGRGWNSVCACRAPLTQHVCALLAALSSAQQENVTVDTSVSQSAVWMWRLRRSVRVCRRPCLCLLFLTMWTRLPALRLPAGSRLYNQEFSSYSVFGQRAPSVAVALIWPHVL